MSVSSLMQRLLWVPVFSAAVFSSPATSVSLVSDDLKLFLPWTEFQGQTYSALLGSAGGGGLAFSLDQIAPREAPSGAAQASVVTVSDSLNVHIPLVNFQGELYSADLNYLGGGGFGLATAAPFVFPQGRGQVRSAEFMESLTAQQIASEAATLGLPPVGLIHDVALYRIGYQTVDAFGNLTPASGVIGVPLGIQRGAPILSYQHGTITSRAEAPSADPSATRTEDVLYLQGASGYLVLAPDYLGFGDSAGLHPYVHAKTLAWAVIDLIRAVRSLADAVDYPLNGQLFLSGYSEGGYATLAAQREIETRHSNEFTITASAPMAGPYDLSGTMLDVALTAAPVPSPLYFPYVLLAYNRVYGFEDQVENLLAADYADTIVGLFDGNHDDEEINAALPANPPDSIAPGLVSGLAGDGYHPLRSALENNDVYRWKPVSPTRLYHCRDDDQVPYANAQVAQQYFTDVGADVELVTLFFGGHSECSVPAMLTGKTWLDSLADLPVTPSD